MVCSDHLGPSNGASPRFLLFIRIRSVVVFFSCRAGFIDTTEVMMPTRRLIRSAAQTCSYGGKLRSTLRYNVIAVHLPFAPPPRVLSGL